MAVPGGVKSVADSLRSRAKQPIEGLSSNDPWRHRSENMCCTTCMWYVEKARTNPTPETQPLTGRCRRRCPTMNGYPVVFSNDWCGDHKLDENKI